MKNLHENFEIKLEGVCPFNFKRYVLCVSRSVWKIRPNDKPGEWLCVGLRGGLSITVGNGDYFNGSVMEFEYRRGGWDATVYGFGTIHKVCVYDEADFNDLGGVEVKKKREKSHD